MRERGKLPVGRSTMEIAIVEVRARNDELARLRERHESLRRRLSRRMHALRTGDLATVSAEDATPDPEGLAWQDDDDDAPASALGDDDKEPSR